MINNASEQIKSKIDIVEFLRGYLELRSAGNNFKAVCPFHKEKTPSLMVSPDRQIWRCFGCNEGGDIFTFLMKYENLEFYEALKILAEKANVPLNKVSPAEHKEFGVLYDINRASADYYINCLHASSNALEYLHLRKISNASIENFEIGFAINNYDDLTLHLINKGFEMSDIVRAGLAIKTEKGRYLDRFRGRIMFPLESSFGRVVGFSGRVLPEFDSGEMGKYINSPETPIFSKSRLLYGLSKSKDAIRENHLALLVEGQIDVISAHQDGVKNTIGSSGTALTSEQLTILRRYTDKIILNFDNDEAGKRAMEKSIDLAKERDFNIEILDFSIFPQISGKKDVADIVASNPGMFSKIISQSISSMEYYFIRYPINVSDIDIKKQNIREILKKIMYISSAIERSHWIRELSFRSGSRESDLLSEIKPLSVENHSPRFVNNKQNIFIKNNLLSQSDKITRKTKIAERLLSLYFVSDLAKSELQRISSYLPETELRLYNAIVSNSSSLDEALKQKIAELSLKSGLEEKNFEQEILELSANLELEVLTAERDALSIEVKSNRLEENERSQKSLAIVDIAKKIEAIKFKKKNGE